MLMVNAPKPIAPYVIGQIVDYVKPSSSRENRSPAQGSIDLRYFVMLTEPNCEIKARDHLKDELGFDPYVPVEEVVTYRSIYTMFGVKRRKVVTTRPIFRGYLFLPLNMAWSFGPLYRVPGLRQSGHAFLKQGGEHVVMDETDIEKLRKAEYAIAHPEDPCLPYKAGDRVRIVDGPFKDLVATISRLDAEDRIELLMDILGRKTTLFAEAFQIDAIT
jgi:transcription antitermination factor NusG